MLNIIINWVSIENVAWGLLYVTTLVGFSCYVRYLRQTRREAYEALEYAEFRATNGASSDGDLFLLGKLEKSVHVLNRRIARLLESPKLYLRARRVTSTLDLSTDELTAELELIMITEAELVDA